MSREIPEWDDMLDIEDNLLNMLGLCGCGLPKEVMRLFERELTRLNVEEHRPDWREGLEKVYGKGEEALDDPLVWAFIYHCDDLGLTEHGGTAWCGWLTGHGKFVLDKLREYLK